MEMRENATKAGEWLVVKFPEVALEVVYGGDPQKHEVRLRSF